jgi:hypothetical protein
VAFCIVFFSFKTNFFFAKTCDGFEGVQRRGPVKGAVCSRSSETLDREHRWNNAGFEKARVEWRKNGEENVFGQEHRMELSGHLEVWKTRDTGTARNRLVRCVY